MTSATPAGACAEDVLERFNAAWNRHDLAAAIALTSRTCVYDPAPGGELCIGHAELEVAWRPMFDDPAGLVTIEESFTAAESFTTGTRVIQRWRYESSRGQSQGVDIVTVRDGLITEKLAYLKG